MANFKIKSVWLSPFPTILIAIVGGTVSELRSAGTADVFPGHDTVDVNVATPFSTRPTTKCLAGRSGEDFRWFTMLNTKAELARSLLVRSNATGPLADILASSRELRADVIASPLARMRLMGSLDTYAS